MRKDFGITTRLEGVGGVYNCYYLNTMCDYGYETSTTGRLTETEMKASGFIPYLGDAFRYNQGGYPKLFWE